MKWMRPKICVPIVAPLRDGIIREAKQIAKLPVEMVEWRIDFFAGYGREILDVITELKRVLNEKELLVTIRTVAKAAKKMVPALIILKQFAKSLNSRRQIMWMLRLRGMKKR